ncbi:hypothetical protein [Oceanobacillus sp. J11TS1]|uniref:hypothetical protein n=1 Tax=Oceanobacillus sp. J11TS1 TaxID=2807191 RepID=UPI001B288D3F|nr:hypothetical protein [Oceanobacillus sp. J11TS1]GIO25378.1 hypothetical protein J11TS1_39590 [Oceanobacillus sp. J11TS1]
MVTNDLFLKQVKVKEFADSMKVGSARKLVKVPNENEDDIYTVVGVTAINEGYTEYDESAYFVMTDRHKVYLVAKSIGRRFKILEEDMDLLEGATNER